MGCGVSYSSGMKLGFTVTLKYTPQFSRNKHTHKTKQYIYMVEELFYICLYLYTYMYVYKQICCERHIAARILQTSCGQLLLENNIQWLAHHYARADYASGCTGWYLCSGLWERRLVSALRVGEQLFIQIG